MQRRRSMTGATRATGAHQTKGDEIDMKDRMQLRAYRVCFAVSSVMAMATALGAPRKFG